MHQEQNNKPENSASSTGDDFAKQNFSARACEPATGDLSKEILEQIGKPDSPGQKPLALPVLREPADLPSAEAGKRNEILSLQVRSRNAALARFGRSFENSKISDRDLERLIDFEDEIVKLRGSLPGAAQSSAEKGLQYVKEFRLRIPIDLLEFGASINNPAGYKNLSWNLIPVAGTMTWIMMRYMERNPQFMLRHPDVKSVRFEPLRQLFREMEALGLEPEMTMPYAKLGEVRAKFRSRY